MTDTYFATKAIQDYIFLPPDPLGELLLTACHDIDSLNDNTIVLGDTAFCLNPFTGRYEPFAQLDAKPDNSDGGVKMPIASAEQVLTLYKRYPGLPVPMQIRAYTRGTPGKDATGWTATMHLRLCQFNTASFSNLTASGIDNDDAVPMVTVPFRHQGFEMLTRDKPGYYEKAAPLDEDPFDLVYIGVPGLDENGNASTGCEELYGIWTTLLQRSLDGGATWATVTSGVTITAGGTLCNHNGRLVMAVGTAIYFSDNPDGGATEWRTATISLAPTSIGRITSNGSSLFAIYNTTGVLRSDDGGRTWSVVVGAGTLTANAMTDISAAGSVVVACGANDAILRSTEGGDAGSWELIGGPGGATTDMFGINVARWNLTDSGSVVMYVVLDDATNRILYRSEDRGTTWELMFTFALTDAVSLSQVVSTLDSWIVYLNHVDLTYKSVDGGRNWDNISNTSVDATQGTRFALCNYNPNECFVIGNSHT